MSEREHRPVYATVPTANAITNSNSIFNLVTWLVAILIIVLDDHFDII